MKEDNVALLTEIAAYRDTISDLTQALQHKISDSDRLSPQRKAYWRDTVQRVVQPETTYLFHLLERLADELATGWPRDPSV